MSELKRLVLDFRGEEIVVRALYRTQDGPTPNTKAKAREVSSLGRAGLEQALEALEALGDMGAFDKDWREEAMARGLGRTTYYRSRGTLLELGYVEQVMNNYFVKKTCKNEVP